MLKKRDIRKVFLGIIYALIVILLAKYLDIATKGTRVTIMARLSPNILKIRISRISEFYEIDIKNKVNISAQKEMYVEKVYKKLIINEYQNEPTYVVSTNQVQSIDNIPQNVYATSIIIPEMGENFAKLCIPTCGIDANVVFGLTQEFVDNYDVALQDAITSVYVNPMIPGFGRPILMGGHNYKSLGKLKYISVGDKITVSTNYGVFYYIVTETKVGELNIHGTTIVDINTGEDLINYYGNEELQIYTCDSLDANDTHRFFVRAVRTGGTRIIF